MPERQNLHNRMPTACGKHTQTLSRLKGGTFYPLNLMPYRTFCHQERFILYS